MNVQKYLKARLYAFGLDDTARAELSGFVRGVIARGAGKLRRGRRVNQPTDYLHFGCGFDRFKGFVNIDRIPTPATDLVIDIRRRLPFATATVRGIFHQHAFEHIDQAIGARTLLKESARILVPGGVLRIGVPDLATYVAAYMAFDQSFAKTIGLADVRYAAHIINYAFGHGHRFLYDFEAMRTELLDAGFLDVRKAAFRDSLDPMLNCDNEDPGRVAGTLFVEARR